MASSVESLVSFLTKSAETCVRASNSHIEKQYLVAKGQLSETYKTHAPEDIPFDLTRVQRDLRVSRDLRMASEADAIRDRIRVTIDLVRLVYQADPDAFARCEKGEKGVIISARSDWSSEDEASVVECIRSHGSKGVTFTQISKECGFGPGSAKRRDCKRFIATQRFGPGSMVTKAGGSARSTRYKIRSTPRK